MVAYFEDFSSTDFVIGQYLNLLTPSPKKEKNKYICPNCGGHNLSINSDGRGYSCYNCEDTRAIARELVKLSGRYDNRPKQIRPKQERNWFYKDLSGNELIKVNRIDNGDGTKKIRQFSKVEGRWVAGLKNIKQSDVTLLYFDTVVNEAVGNDELLFLVEGESCVDALLSVGIKATTNLGGSGKNIKAYEILEGDNIVISPDRDLEGFKHTEKLSKLFPNAKWFYPYPKSKLWCNLPPSKGLDVVDYINDLKVENLTDAEIKERILNELEDKRIKNEINLNSLEKSLNKSQETTENNLKNITDFINEYSKPEYNISDIRAIIIDFSSSRKISPQTIENAIKSKRENDCKKDDLKENSARLNNFLEVPKEKLNLHKLIGYLGSCLDVESRNIPTNSMALFTILLGVISGVMGSKFSVLFRGNYRQPTILRTGIIADSGSKKSPIISIITKPLEQIHIEYYERYKLESLEYESNQNLALEKREKLPIPVRKRILSKDGTVDGILRIHQDNPNGFVVVVGELAGYFNRLNKFSRGGDDVDRDLELYDGGLCDKVRADKDNDIVIKKTGVSVTGGLQWIAAEKLFNASNDERGITARWLFWGGDLPVPLIPDNYENSGIGECLDNLYRTILDIPSQDFILSEEAKTIFVNEQRALVMATRELISNQVKAKFSKGEGEYLRVAGVLHIIRYVMGIESNLAIISADTMRGAVEVVNYYLRQFEYISMKCGNDLQDNQILKILEIVKSKGECTQNDLKRRIRDFKNQPTENLTNLLLLLIDNGQLKKVDTQKGLRVKLP